MRKKRIGEGGYDAWGVRWPSGGVREFSTFDRAAEYAGRMEGQDVIQDDGTVETWIGLTVVHRYIPEWTDVDPDPELGMGDE